MEKLNTSVCLGEEAPDAQRGGGKGAEPWEGPAKALPAAQVPVLWLCECRSPGRGLPPSACPAAAPQ